MYNRGYICLCFCSLPCVGGSSGSPRSSGGFRDAALVGRLAPGPRLRPDYPGRQEGHPGQSSLAGNRGDRARWKGEVRSLRKELQRREQVRGSVILCVYRRLEIFVFNNFRRYPTTTKINNTDFFSTPNIDQ
jgi:hypothetical protein